LRRATPPGARSRTSIRLFRSQNSTSRTDSYSRLLDRRSRATCLQRVKHWQRTVHDLFSSDFSETAATPRTGALANSDSFDPTASLPLTGRTGHHDSLRFERIARTTTHPTAAATSTRNTTSEIGMFFSIYPNQSVICEVCPHAAVRSLMPGQRVRDQRTREPAKR
jgi:hypothetical protein